MKYCISCNEPYGKPHLERCPRYIKPDPRDTELSQLREQVAKMKKALEHYADEGLYFPRSIIRLCVEEGLRVAPIYADFGEVATKALKEDNG